MYARIIFLSYFLINHFLIVKSNTVHKIGNRNFWYIQELHSYPDAKDACLEKGAQLAVFRNHEELNYFKNEHLSGWIGMTCVNGQHLWTDGRSVSFGKWLNSDKCWGDDGVIFNGDGFMSMSDTTFYVICSEIRSYESEILLPAI